MMITSAILLHSFLVSVSLLISSVSGLNSDGTILLSFKNSQPSSLLQNWNHSDANPCSWTGVTCSPQNTSVVTILLPNSHLLGPIPDDFGRLQHLRLLDLSNNSISGTLPTSIFNCSNLQTLSLSSNLISGELPEFISGLQSLRVLNLSDNAFVGKVPESLGSLNSLISVSLKNNYFSGDVPGGFDSVEVLDLSSNLFNGNLPLDFGGGRLNYLNLSNNKISGSVFLQFAEKIPATAVVDFSFNNFTGEIPQTASFANQKTECFAGNINLCGKPLKKMCTVPSSLSTPRDVSSDDSATAAIAAIPKSAGKSRNHGGWKIFAIVVGDVAAIILLAILFFYIHQIRKNRPKIDESTACSCFNGVAGEGTSETESIPESAGDDENGKKCLVMVDGETELEMETLLKASAYILGSSGRSIVYKAVVGGGGADGGGSEFAVRRIGDSGVKNMREFEKIVRFIGKFRHRNLVKVRGFFWGEEEKLVIYDYVVNGSLAAGAAYKKVSSSSCHLPFEVRLKIAIGMANGLCYIHEKKQVHGNIKPNNILLTSEMDPMISDFGLDWIISGKINHITDKSTRNIGIKRSTSSHEETLTNHDHHHIRTNNSCVAPPTGLHGASPYRAPESVKALKPNPKWDVYSFGIILLELLLGKTLSDKELSKWNMDASISDIESKILKMVNEFITTDEHAKKDFILTCFKLGFRCASSSPQRRPSMKEALRVLEKNSVPIMRSQKQRSE